MIGVAAGLGPPAARNRKGGWIPISGVWSPFGSAPATGKGMDAGAATLR
jgi:hypothetical protein